MSQIAKSKRGNAELCCLVILTGKNPKISLAVIHRKNADLCLSLLVGLLFRQGFTQVPPRGCSLALRDVAVPMELCRLFPADSLPLRAVLASHWLILAVHIAL